MKKSVILLFILVMAVLATSLPALAIHRHQGNGVDSFIPAGVNSVRDWKIEIGNSSKLQTRYQKVFGNSYSRINSGCWEYWCTNQDYELTVYCVKQKDGRVYATRQLVSAGTPVLGYRDCDNVRRILILADCGNPITKCLPVPYCPPAPKPECKPEPLPEPEPEPEPEPVPTSCLPAPCEKVVICEEPIIPLPSGMPRSAVKGSTQIRLAESGILGSVITAGVLIPTKVPSTNISTSTSQAQSTGDTNVGPTNVTTGPTNVSTGPTNVSTGNVNVSQSQGQGQSQSQSQSQSQAQEQVAQAAAAAAAAAAAN